MSAFQADGHLREDALLLLAEGDLARRSARHAQRHLDTCGTCRTRLHTLRAADEDLRSVSLAATQKHNAEELRGRLADALAHASALEPSVGWWSRLALVPGMLLRPGMALRASAVLLLLVVAATFRQVSRPLQDLMAAYEDTGPEPDHRLTPGSAVAMSVAEVCRLPDDDLDPPVAAETRRAVFRAYRMDDRASKAYQMDYLINPQLGGDGSLQNLWPEPYHATVWNATAKDALETRLHGLVCSGQLDLRTAQQELAGDWIAAYKKYFGTQRPARTVAALEGVLTR